MTLVTELQAGFRSNSAEARRQRRAVGAALSRLQVLVEQSARAQAYELALRAQADRARALRTAFGSVREHARASNAAHLEAVEYANAYAALFEGPQYQ